VAPRPLFRRALGSWFENLPPVIKNGHEVDERLRLVGRASVTGAESLPGRVLARLLGFPPESADVPVAVEMRADRDGEVWVRNFGGCTFRSHLAPIRGRRARVSERFGPLTCELELRASADRLEMIVVGGRIGPISLPRSLLPRSHASEGVDAAGRFCFDVPIALPGFGRIVHYRGWLAPRTPL
jgi:hypothetical protein